MTSQERDLLAPPVAFPHIPFQNTKLCSAPSVSPRLRDPFTRTSNLDFFFVCVCVCVCVQEALERLALLHRFPLLFYRWPVWYYQIRAPILLFMTLFRQLLVFYDVVSMGAAFTIMGVNPKQRRIAFTELQSKLNRSKYIPVPPLRHHQSSHVCSHILRGGTFLLSPAERFSEISQVQQTWTPSPTPKNLSAKDV